jgi:LuxR family maltose regulon positive regulatory protein
MARSEQEEALRLLEWLREAAETAGGMGRVIEILSLQALALRAGGRKDEAVSTLARALTLAEPEGYVSTFVDEGPEMITLLSEVLEAQQRGASRPRSRRTTSGSSQRRSNTTLPAPRRPVPDFLSP